MAEAAVPLWDLACWGRQAIRPGQAYAWDNAIRPTRGRVDCQVTLAGRLVWRDRTGERRVGPGTVVLFRHGDRTAYRADPTAGTYRCAWVELHGDGLTTHWAWLLARCGAVVAGDAAAAMARAVEDLLAVAERAATGPSARFAAVARFVAALVAAAEGDRRRAGSAADLAVDEIIADPARIGRIAGHARRWRLSREHLSRCFHRRTGRPLTAWLAERRLAAARLLLAGTALDAAAVAAQSGFASSTALRRALRAAGLPAPQAWRQRTAE